MLRQAVYAEAYPDAKPGSIPTCAGMLYRFVNEVQVGDYIVFPSKLDRIINIGVVESEYKYDGTENDYVQQRDVKWLKHIQRTSFSQGALYEIGSALSFFAVKNYADEFLSALDKNFKKNIRDILLRKLWRIYYRQWDIGLSYQSKAEIMA